MRQGHHGMLPDNTQDEFSRQSFVQSLKLHLARQVSPRLKLSYEQKVRPAFEKQHKRAPKSRHEVHDGMLRDGNFQMWSSLQRTSQELKQDSQTEIAFRQIDRLADRARKLVRGSNRVTVRSKPDLAIPRYATAVDIHTIPGGYHNELINDDVMTGAVYDPGVWLYSMGRMGAYNEDIGATLISFLKGKHPGFRPKRILDMGCAVGHSTLPYTDAYPDAEIHALDIAGPMVRYGAARAASLGKAVQFSQQNAEATDYPDGFFDLIVSHILLHETSHKGLRNIVRESHRLLAPGGLMIHAETPSYGKLADPYDQFILDWDTYYNNEPYWGPLKDEDLRGITAAAGFKRENYFEQVQPSAVGGEHARNRTRLFQGGDFGGAGAWFLWGAAK